MAGEANGVQNLKTSPQRQPPRGLLGDIAASIYEPGVNAGLLLFMHAAFLSLLLSLATMVWMTGGRNAHVLILALIALSLYVIIIWFVSEIRVTLRRQKELTAHKQD